MVKNYRAGHRLRERAGQDGISSAGARAALAAIWLLAAGTQPAAAAEPAVPPVGARCVAAVVRGVSEAAREKLAVRVLSERRLPSGRAGVWVLHEPTNVDYHVPVEDISDCQP
jgi:hypothetical protein